MDICGVMAASTTASVGVGVVFWWFEFLDGFCEAGYDYFVEEFVEDP